eukprot:5770145-Alexandrium_andersonii.AAC.1
MQLAAGVRVRIRVSERPCITQHARDEVVDAIVVGNGIVHEPAQHEVFQMPATSVDLGLFGPCNAPRVQKHHPP